MAKLLPPSVGERLAQCGTQVEVWGIEPGANVTLEVNGAAQTVSVNATGHVFTVGALPPNAKVRARQQRGADGSDWGNEANAEPVTLPPPPPHAEPSVPRCIQCIFVWGVAPGSKVDVQQGVNLTAATGVAGREGYACMPITEPPMQAYRAMATTCGQVSGQVHVKVDPQLSEVPKPKIVEPVFECQTVLGFQQLIPGAAYEISVTDRDGAQSSLGTFCACTPNMTVGVPRVFKPGDRFMAVGSMVNDRWECRVRGRKSDEVAAVRPDDRIKPVIEEPVWEHDPLIYVTNQIPGGTITLKRKEDAQSSEEDLGHRPSSKEPEVAVGTDLRAGNIIWIVQELCGVIKESNQVTVKGRPPNIPPPKVRRPVWNCAQIVIVDDVIPGATVSVRQVPMGQAGPEILLGKRKSFGTSVAVPCSPTPQNGHEVLAYQESVASNRVPVELREDMPPPVVTPPIKPGDTTVWCEELLVGAHVRLFNTTIDLQTVTYQIGAGVATDTSEAIPVWGTVPQSARVSATQLLCREGRRSAEEPARDGQPCDGPPQYDPGKWNNDPFHRRCNNCYNYATDRMLDNFAQPGGSVSKPECQCATITTKVLGDNLRKCTGGSCHPCHHKVALVMAPGRDFHWYRQDANGMWSHKRGQTAAKNVDESSNPISNPETADRAMYTDFCGYFCVYKPDLSLSGTCPDE